MRKTPLAWGLAAVVLCSGMAHAQSLGEVAKKEEERRKAIKAPGKVYTNDDLRKYPVGPPPVPPGEGGAAATAPGSPGDPVAVAKAQGGGIPAPEKVEETRDEAYWRKRITDARDQLRRSEAFLEAMQTRVNSLTNDFYARDDPAQREAIWAQRTAALEEMERLTQEIADLKKSITDIEEEARREGVPPGWLR